MGGHWLEAQNNLDVANIYLSISDRLGEIVRRHIQQMIAKTILHRRGYANEK
jgi:hypothetical protein